MERFVHVPAWTLLTISMTNSSVPFHSSPASLHLWLRPLIWPPCTSPRQWDCGVDDDAVKSKAELNRKSSRDYFLSPCCVAGITWLTRDNSWLADLICCFVLYEYFRCFSPSSTSTVLNDLDSFQFWLQDLFPQTTICSSFMYSFYSMENVFDAWCCPEPGD